MAVINIRPANSEIGAIKVRSDAADTVILRRIRYEHPSSIFNTYSIRMDKTSKDRDLSLVHLPPAASLQV